MITVTDRAKKYLTQVLDTNYAGIYVDVQGQGCSGFTYKVEPVLSKRHGEIYNLEHHFVNIASEVFELVGDITVDYTQSDFFDAKLTVTGDKEKGRCGCESSFFL